MERMTPDIPKRTVTTNSKSVLNLDKNRQASHLKYTATSISNDVLQNCHKQ